MEFHPIPQPKEIPIREREDAMGAYLMMFASVAAGLPLPIINLIASVIYFYINKTKSKFVYFHSLQSLYSQFPTSIINAVAVFWSVRIFLLEEMSVTDNYKGYLVMALIANLLYFIFSLIAAFKARKGHFYYFLFFGKIAYQRAYMVKTTDGNEQFQSEVNKPPSL